MTSLWSILLLLLLLALIAAVTMSVIVGWKLTHPPRKDVEMNPNDFGIQSYEEVSFYSRDRNILLSGWYLSATENGHETNGHTVIFAHGYSQNRQEPHLPALSLAARLVSCGYDILMFDFRNAGLSQGSVTTVGFHEQADLQGAIDFALSIRPDHKIGLIGFSMGASTALLVAGKDERVQAVVADSPFYCLEEYLKESLPAWTGLPAFPFNRIILTVVPLLLRAHPKQVRPWTAVSQISPRPVLFIHGTGDVTISSAHSCRLYELVKHTESELWLVPEAGHVRSYALSPEEYSQRVLAFFEKHMLQKTKQSPLIS